MFYASSKPVSQLPAALFAFSNSNSSNKSNENSTVTTADKDVLYVSHPLLPSQQMKLRFVPMRYEFIRLCVEMVARSFTSYGHPLATHIDYETGSFQFYAQYFLERSLDTTTLCINAESGYPVGVAVNNDYNLKVEIWFERMLSKRYGRDFARIHALHDASAQPFKEAFPELLVNGKVWYQEFVAVEPGFGGTSFFFKPKI